jgi:hypothetical protein
MKRFLSTENLFLVKNLFFFRYNGYLLEFVTQEGKVYPAYSFVLEKSSSYTFIRIFTTSSVSSTYRYRTSIRFYKTKKYELMPYTISFRDCPDDYNVTKECLDMLYKFIENKIIQYDVEEG